MVDKLIQELLYPDFGSYAMAVYEGMKDESLSPELITDMMVKLHRKAVEDYNDDEGSWRYLDVCDLGFKGMAFLLICLKYMILNGRAVKKESKVVFSNSVLDLGEVKNRLSENGRELTDEDMVMSGWIRLTDEFLAWTPDEAGDTFATLLNHLNSKNAAVIFGFCSRAYRLDEDLKKMEQMSPKDFLDAAGLREYHAYRIHSTFCYSFLEQANDHETEKATDARYRAEKSASVEEMLLALAELEVYLNMDPVFPYTVYKLLTDENYTVQFKKKPTEEEMRNDDSDIPEELKHVFLAAKDGDATAQSELASRYLVGKLLPRDEFKALFWMKLAADAGDALAQTNYGVALQNGTGGIERNYKEAIEWFHKAAAQGEPVAQYNLGIAYMKGMGVDRDPAEMRRWLKLSAENGYFMAQLMLSSMPNTDD